MQENIMKNQRKYSKELKEEAIKMIFKDGLANAEVSDRLGIPKGTIGGWVARAKTNEDPVESGQLSQKDLLVENARLRKELANAKMEREILKKATAYFAKESLPGTRL